MENKIMIEGRVYEISVPYRFSDTDMIVFKDIETDVRSVRFILMGIFDDYGKVRDGQKERLISGYLKNYEDSLKCETVEIDLDEYTANDLDALCDQCGVSRHAFFSGASKYLCDPENRERIIERLQSALKGFPGFTDNAMDTALMQTDKEADRNPERV